VRSAHCDTRVTNGCGLYSNTKSAWGAGDVMVREFGAWLQDTPFAEGLRNILWLVPVSQSIHILSVAVLFSSVLFINFRLLGLVNTGRSVSEVVEQHVPWVWRALIVLLLTGLTQTVVETLRQVITPIFWYKMLLIVIVAVMTARFARQVRANAAQWDAPAARPSNAKSFALASTALWVVIIVFGRFIGYVWALYL
jgi:hypothetical protein